MQGLEFSAVVEQRASGGAESVLVGVEPGQSLVVQLPEGTPAQKARSLSPIEQQLIAIESTLGELCARWDRLVAKLLLRAAKQQQPPTEEESAKHAVLFEQVQELRRRFGAVRAELLELQEKDADGISRSYNIFAERYGALLEDYQLKLKSAEEVMRHSAQLRDYFDGFVQ